MDDKQKKGLKETMGELYTPKEVAEYYKVTLSAVYTWVKTGKLKGHVITQGKRKTTVRFDINQLKQFSRSLQGEAA